MGADERTPVGTVIEQLLARPQKFNLFQAISLLEMATQDAGGCAGGVPEVRLRSHVTLVFEPSDIRHIEPPEPGDLYTLYTSALGLAGAGGPLPLSFTELLLERMAKRDRAMTDFLDIFNHRFLSFLYRSRRRHSVALSAFNPARSALVSTLDAIGSLGWRQPGKEAVPMWLRHTGLFSGAPRSMAGLLSLLRDRLGLRIRGRQFAGQWLDLEDSAVSRLNGSAALGGGAVLGRRVWDQAAGIELVLQELTREQLHSCLPGGSTCLLLQHLVHRYMGQVMEVHMVLEPAAGCGAQGALGTRGAMKLGWSAWLAGGEGLLPAPVRLRLADSNV